MVLSPGTNVGAKVTTVQSPGNTDPNLATSPTLKSPVANSRPSAILQVHILSKLFNNHEIFKI